jgi:hypothetical protein
MSVTQEESFESGGIQLRWLALAGGGKELQYRFNVQTSPFTSRRSEWMTVPIEWEQEK